MSFLVIGPFPLPIDGCSYANQILAANLIKQNIPYDFINTNTNIISSKQGNKFSFKKAFSFVPVYLSSYKIFKAKAVYLTPGQTFFGILKYSPFILLCIVLGKPYVVHVHGNYLGEQYRALTGIKKKIFHFLLSRCSAGIVLSKSLVRNFEGLLSADKIFVVENFAENSLYDLPALNKPKDKPRLLYLSNLMLEKGILDFLDALLLLKKSNVNFKAVVGGSIVADLKDEIQKRFDALGTNLEYAGVITGAEKKKKLLESNIFVLPTYYKMEGQPISLLEGLATGNIIITTNHAGIPDIISEANGFLVNPRSPSGIAAVVEEINKDVGYFVTKFCQNNINYAASTFTEDAFSNKIVTILNKVKK
jgi:glycosyltransferase involved in cell wall biosynthesis